MSLHTPAQKLQRFDDVYKLLVTLLTIALAFGSRFLTDSNKGLGLADIAGIYTVAVVCWGIGHLYEDIQMETCFKLAGWFGLALLVPAVFSDVGILAILQPPSPYSVPVPAFSFVAYWLGYRYLRENLNSRNKLAMQLIALLPILAFYAGSLGLYVLRYPSLRLDSLALLISFTTAMVFAGIVTIRAFCSGKGHKAGNAIISAKDA